jgi:sugar phosphate isomerase/epimerase
MFLYEYDVESIAKASELSGYDGIEFWVETPHFWIDRREEKLETIREKILAVHSPVLDLNPVSVNRNLCELTLKETLYSIDLTKKLNVKVVTIHAGKRSALREPVWADYASLKNYLRVCSKYSKLKNVILCLENSEPKVNYLCKTPEEVLENLKEFNLGFTFDLNHATKNSELNAEGFLDFFNRIENIHVSGYDSKGRHVSFIGFERIEKLLKTLSEIGYDKKITVELDDLGLRIGKFNFEKKVELLKKEGRYLRKFFRR